MRSLFGPCRRGRECRAARRGARAAVSRRSSARRGNSRLRLLPLAIPSARASPARCAPGIRGPRPGVRCLLRCASHPACLPERPGRLGSAGWGLAACAPDRLALRAPRGPLRTVRRRPVRSAPLPGPHRLHAASRIASAPRMLPARPRPLRLLRPVRIRAPLVPDGANFVHGGIYKTQVNTYSPTVLQIAVAGSAAAGGTGLRVPSQGCALLRDSRAGRAEGVRRRRGLRRPRRCRARPPRGRSGAGKGEERTATSRTPRSGPRGRVRRGVRPAEPPGSRRSRTRAPPGFLLRGITASAKTRSRMRGDSEAGRGRGWDREPARATAASTRPSERGPRARRVRAPPNGPAFGNTAFWEPRARGAAGRRKRPEAKMRCARAEGGHARGRVVDSAAVPREPRRFP